MRGTDLLYSACNTVSYLVTDMRRGKGSSAQRMDRSIAPIIIPFDLKVCKKVKCAAIATPASLAELPERDSISGSLAL